MVEFNAESLYGRFVGAQFDLNSSPKYQEEVILVVKAKVTEKVFRSSPSGTTREISVLKPEEVYVPVGSQGLALRKMFGIENLTLPSLGSPVQLELGSLSDLEENQIYVEDGFVIPEDATTNIEFEDALVSVSTPVELEVRQTADKPRSLPLRVGQTTDPILARFLTTEDV